MTPLEQRISKLIRPTIEHLACQLHGCHLTSDSGRSVLRVYIDRQPGGVTIDDCADVSRKIGSVLDVEDMIKGRYALEVTSPGIDRPLFELAHYEAAVGELVKLKLLAPKDGQRNFKGLLAAVEGETLLVDVDGNATQIAINDIEHANVIGNIKP